MLHDTWPESSEAIPRDNASASGRVPPLGTSALVVERDARGYPAAAWARCLVQATPARLWSVVSNVAAYSELVPMLHHVRVERDLATVQLRVGFGLFGSSFSFVARVEEAPDRSIELAYVSGEPVGMRLRFELSPGTVDGATLLSAHVAFDPDSLGWLAALMSKRHPELRYGIVPGCALALAESVRQRAEAR